MYESSHSSLENGEMINFSLSWSRETFNSLSQIYSGKKEQDTYARCNFLPHLSFGCSLHR